MSDEKKKGFFSDLEEFDDGRIWSLEEIDALLSGQLVHDEPLNAQSEAEKAQTESVAAEKQEKTAETETVALEEPAKEPEVTPAFEEKEEAGDDETEKAYEPEDDDDEEEDDDGEELSGFRLSFAQKDEDGQIGFSAIDLEQEEPEEEEEQQEESVPDEGQISIEKTRVFNEVDTSARFNANIEHNITDQRVVHTTTDKEDNIVSRSNRMESDKIREKFINPPVKDIEKTAEHKAMLEKLPPKTIERAGFFVESGTKSSTSDLEPLPTIVSADTVKFRNEKPSVGNEEEIDEDQIVFEGFNSEEEIETVDEFEAETELIRRRKEKAKNFRLFPNLKPLDDEPLTEETDNKAEEIPTAPERIEDGEEDEEIFASEDKDGSDSGKKEKRAPAEEVIEREFYGEKDIAPVTEILERKKQNALVRLFISAAAFIILTALSLLSSTGEFSLFNDSPTLFLAVNTGILVVSALMNFDVISNGAKGLFTRTPNTDSAVFASFAAAIIQNAVLFAFPADVEISVHVYSCAAAFALLANRAALYIKISRIRENFNYVSADRDFYVIKKIEDEDSAFEIGRGLFMGDPDIRYNAMTRFESGFVENSFKNEPSSYTVIKAVPVAVIVSVLLGIAAGFMTKSIPIGVTAFAGTVCFASPVAAFLSSAYLFSSMSKKLTSEDSLIVGYNSAEELTKSNAVVFDAAELFDTEHCKSYGFKIFNSMRPDEAMLYTSAVMIAAGGPLANLFRFSVIGERDIFPTVENLNYEDKLGCSAWVEHNKRVLVGNRDLLINHNVEVLDKEYEMKLRRFGRQVIYLAVEHVLSAIYVVGYEPDSEVAALLRKLEKNSIPILVRTTDQNITEDFIEESFALPKNSVKVISSVAGEMFSDIYEEITEKDSSGVLHDGTPRAFLSVFNSAFTFVSRLQIASILQYIGVALGICLMALMAFSGALTQGEALKLVIFQALWSAVTLLVPKIKK